MLLTFQIFLLFGNCTFSENTFKEQIYTCILGPKCTEISPSWQIICAYTLHRFGKNCTGLEKLYIHPISIRHVDINSRSKLFQFLKWTHTKNIKTELIIPLYKANLRFNIFFHSPFLGPYHNLIIWYHLEYLVIFKRKLDIIIKELTF